MTIRSARAGEEAELTELAIRSKGHWGHDATFLERARPELTMRPDHLERWIVRVAERDASSAGTGGAVVGFAAVDLEARELEMLFVDPPAIGTGAGRALLRDALEQARAAGLEELVIESDPDAEPFYRSQGAAPAGTRTSWSTGRELPLLRIRTSSA